MTKHHRNAVLTVVSTLMFTISVMICNIEFFAVSTLCMASCVFLIAFDNK